MSDPKNEILQIICKKSMKNKCFPKGHLTCHTYFGIWF